jgi:hypothetical protein
VTDSLPLRAEVEELATLKVVGVAGVLADVLKD